MNQTLNKLNKIKILKRINFDQVRNLNSHLDLNKGYNIQVEENEDKKYFACIHLEPTFPYEHTKPIVLKEEVKKTDSLLKPDILEQLKSKRKISDLDLQRLTYTAKNHWRKNYSYKKTYAKKVNIDREGI